MRKSEITRNTKETKIALKLDLDGGEVDIKTGSGFFNHMLTLFASHAKIGLEVVCDGDTDVDFHHSCEDIGIVLGQAFCEAIGDKRGINRYGSIILPMDEALVMCSMDVSGRSYLNYDVELKASRLEDCGEETKPTVGVFDCELVEEFFTAFVRTAGVTLHIKKLDGKNTHHILEGVFKAFGRVVREACKIVDDELPSTKGVL